MASETQLKVDGDAGLITAKAGATYQRMSKVQKKFDLEANGHHGTVSITLDGHNGNFSAKTGVAAIYMNAIQKYLCLQSFDGSAKICIYPQDSYIKMQLGSLKIFINRIPGAITLAIGDIGISIGPGSNVSINVATGCLSISKLIELLFKLIEIVEYIPGLPDDLKISDDEFLCDNWIPVPNN